MSRFASRILAGLLITGLIATCGIGQLYAQANTAASDTATSVTQQPVKVLEAGAEPRTPLRYSFGAEGKETAVYRLDMSMAMAGGGTPIPKMVLPTMEMAMSTTPSSVDAETGDLAYRTKIKRATVVGEGGNKLMRDSMQTSLKDLEGVEATGQVTTRGQFKNYKQVLKAGTSKDARQIMDSVEQSMRQSVIPFPEEAVGVGAKWEAKTSVSSNGVQVQQVATYEILERTETTVKLRLTMKQTARSQPLAIPDAPPGVTATMDSLTTTGTGTMSVNLASVVPALKMDTTTNAVMSANNGGQSQTMHMTLTMSMEIKPKAKE
ncbi:MAG: hypothetical protein CMH54_02435 [Myxococcales bacterium]|nr:hypothetical protein [Myxococcales bacterium]|tara:strand:+ start:4809 stop:5771 length:963 start_codon:yes stop_codon:yes gene_type:complete